MFYLSRAKIIIISIIIILIFILFLMVKEHNTIIQTMAFPIKNKVVVLDAGHGYPDNRSF